MIIIDPVTLGETSLSSGGGSYFDRDGMLQTAPANVPRVTYDPTELSKPPYALIEPTATNSIRNNTMQGAAAGTPGTMPTNWLTWTTTQNGIASSIVAVGQEGNVNFIDVRFHGTAAVTGTLWTGSFEGAGVIAAAIGQGWAQSCYCSLVAGAVGSARATLRIAEYPVSGPALWSQTGAEFAPAAQSLSGQRKEFAFAVSQASAAYLVPMFRIGGISGENYDFTVRIGLPQLERDRVTSPIKTSGATVMRAGDVIAPTAGLLYSNVVATEPLWGAGTYALDAKVRDAAHVVYQSLVAGNTAPLTDGLKWKAVGVTAPRAMFDQYNNTQTTQAEEIVVVVSPQAISQGLFLGNVDGSEIRLSQVDSVEGLVYSEVKSLVSPSQGSSFYNWAFRRIKRSNYFITTKMLPYPGSLVTVAIRKPGGVAKCGMCAIGPVDEFGPSLYGLSTEGKDYSSTTFDPDGISSTKIRPYAKRMSVDVVIDNQDIEYVELRLEELRQRPIVWIGGPYGNTAVFGRYGSFRNVIEYLTRSRMALQIEGSV